jgi:hypothetical protein
MKRKGTKPKAKKESAPTTPPAPRQVIELDSPPPEHLLELARGEEKKVDLEQYSEVISTLRDDKDFTFREITEWLCGNGVPTDQNTVYRVYTKHMSHSEALQAEFEDQQTDEERA